MHADFYHQCNIVLRKLHRGQHSELRPGPLALGSLGRTYSRRGR